MAELIAVVGNSGSGKSTIIKLIAGYIYPQTGSVVIDGQELPNPTNDSYVSLQSYYKHISYLTQEPGIFDGSIYENLTYALEYIPTDEELEKRRENWLPREPRITSGYLARYAALVTSGNRGAILQVPGK